MKKRYATTAAKTRRGWKSFIPLFSCDSTVNRLIDHRWLLKSSRRPHPIRSHQPVLPDGSTSGESNFFAKDYDSQKIISDLN